jgi:hypothetical protein
VQLAKVGMTTEAAFLAAIDTTANKGAMGVNSPFKPTFERCYVTKEFKLVFQSKEALQQFVFQVPLLYLGPSPYVTAQYKHTVEESKLAHTVNVKPGMALMEVVDDNSSKAIEHYHIGKYPSNMNTFITLFTASEEMVEMDMKGYKMGPFVFFHNQEPGGGHARTLRFTLTPPSNTDDIALMIPPKTADKAAQEATAVAWNVAALKLPLYVQDESAPLPTPSTMHGKTRMYVPMVYLKSERINARCVNCQSFHHRAECCDRPLGTYLASPPPRVKSTATQVTIRHKPLQYNAPTPHSNPVADSTLSFPTRSCTARVEVDGRADTRGGETYPGTEPLAEIRPRCVSYMSTEPRSTTNTLRERLAYTRVESNAICKTQISTTHN